ncbi:MAG: cell filamentation protein [Mycobacterium sp.]|nr:cell filamentation protein [Mycobacterium sp.]
MAWQDYFWPDSDVLRNKLDIRDATQLDAAEQAMAQARQVEITLGRVSIEETGDAEQLRRLHHWLFQDVYTFAGEYRTVELAKISRFAAVDQIGACLDHAAGIVEAVAWDQIDDEQFSDRAAAVYGWVNYAHPFAKATAERRGYS